MTSRTWLTLRRKCEKFTVVWWMFGWRRPATTDAAMGLVESEGPVTFRPGRSAKMSREPPWGEKT